MSLSNQSIARSVLTFGKFRAFRVLGQKEKLLENVLYMFLLKRCQIHPLKRAVMADQIVITEKTSQAKDVRAAVGSRYGDILPAEGHLFDLLEPEDVVPAWKRWSPILLRPEGLYGTRPAEGGNKAAKLKAIRDALRTAERVWLATDCDREGQLIGQEILEHYKYRGEVMRDCVHRSGLRRPSPCPTHL